MKNKLLLILVMAMLVVGLSGVIGTNHVSAITPGTGVNYYLHGNGTLTLDTVAPTGTTVKYVDSLSLPNRTTWKDVGTWTDPVSAPTALKLKLSPLDVWLGLKNSDDQGTWFDLKAEVLKNGTVVAAGTTSNIQGVTRNPDLALKVTVNFSPIAVTFSQGDTLGLRISAKVTATGGHNNAVGLRLYYDMANRASNFDATTQYLVHYVATGNVLPVAVPPDEWVDYGSAATGIFPALVTDGAGTQCVFVSDNRPATITGPTTITGIYQTQYQLTMATNFGTTSPAVGNSWCNAGSVVTIQATAPVAGPGEQYIWNGWTGVGTISYSGNNNPANNAVTMNSPVTETASWTYQFLGQELLTALSPANIWVGLKNSDDVGTEFDLLAEVLKNGVVVGSGQLNSVDGGSSGFNNALLRTIDLALSETPTMSSGDTLSIRLSVRIATLVSGHRSGTARLWFNDSQAYSNFDATIGGVSQVYFLGDGFTLNNSVGSGPKKTIDVFVDKLVDGNPFKPFGTWSITLP